MNPGPVLAIVILVVGSPAGAQVKPPPDATSTKPASRPARFSPLFEHGWSIGETYERHRSREPAVVTFGMAAGVETACWHGWRWGAVVDLPLSLSDGGLWSPAVSLLGRMTQVPDLRPGLPPLLVRFAIGPTLTCDGCRGFFQDMGLLGRVSVGVDRRFTLDLQLRAQYFDVGRPVRPVGARYDVQVGVTLLGRWVWAGLLANALVGGIILLIHPRGSSD